ncbi:uncharacterized protein HMPREF1541_02912 [Cyphellophora europaea CBS 101466]|uniref:SnoaL-like domain-containing protein n=1 Tax=Cyphellophora europaea (strain CBS 101466) TaxID=1220924 RepID=W2S6T2_CYPE1|nr:uncharacterized protein HMPREF1541_02912 [Cyphellophora europaea CBS 101466]ETN43753.1 hypothetical protein HMPREF1541_02912 [Cyphellophora europaea CBS 101466]
MVENSINIVIETSQSRETMTSIIHRDVNFFSYRDPIARRAAIEEVFHVGVVWFDFDGTIHRGHDGLLARSSLLLEQMPGTIHHTEGAPSICQNMVTQRWYAVREGDPNASSQAALVQGCDVAVVEGKKIKVLWSCVDRFDEQALPGLGKGPSQPIL